jgi:uncharacterized protein (DUF362 family)
MVSMTDSEVFLIRTSDRGFGIRSLLQQFDLDSYSGKRIAIKANYNSADPFPASTHPKTLETIVRSLKDAGISELTLAERSGMGDTRRVLEECGVLGLSEKLGFKVVVLDEEGKDHWVRINRDNMHWHEGFPLSKVFYEADKVVQTCCLKTHRFGGHFTISLKNSVGLIAKQVPGEVHDYMWELHNSPHQRLMIAEINTAYHVDLVIMDAMKAFITQGPERGKIVEPNLLLASNDRVAIDAVGVALLRTYQSTPNVMRGRIFELDQIHRAAELGIGVQSASNIKLIPVDNENLDDAKKIEQILKS